MRAGKAARIADLGEMLEYPGEPRLDRAGVAPDALTLTIHASRVSAATAITSGSCSIL